MPYELSANMAQELARHKAAYELFTVERGGHGLGRGDPKRIAQARARALDLSASTRVDDLPRLHIELSKIKLRQRRERSTCLRPALERRSPGGTRSLTPAATAQVLGPPDDDRPYGAATRYPEREDTAPVVESFRTLRYSGLSETADVNLTESRTGDVHVWLQGKYLALPPHA